MKLVWHRMHGMHLAITGISVLLAFRLDRGKRRRIWELSNLVRRLVFRQIQEHVVWWQLLQLGAFKSKGHGKTGAFKLGITLDG